MGRLVFSAEAMRALRAHLAAAFPEEGCGLLVGEEGAGLRRVAEAIAVENQAADRSRRFEISPERFLEEERRARAAGREVVGFYHSHPGSPAEPSVFDRERAWPWYTYAIAGVTEDGVEIVRCWRLDESGFQPEEWSVAERLA